jgi:hypothetical protein
MRQFMLATDRKRFASRAVLPIASIFVPACVWLGYYNLRLTGHVLETPYAVWSSTYQSDGAELRHLEFERYHGSGDLTVAQKLRRLWAFYWMPAFWLLLPTLPCLLRWRSSRLALGLFLAVSLASVAVSRGWPHYTAPVSCLYFLVLAKGLGRLAHVKIAGLRLRWLVVVLLLVQLYTMIDLFRQQAPAVWFSDWQYARTGIERELEAAAGDDLIVVRYAPQHDVHREWVYNRADIDKSPVVWAREMGPEEDARLFAYFRDRRWWLLYADAIPPRLVPYPERP